MIISIFAIKRVIARVAALLLISAYVFPTVWAQGVELQGQACARSRAGHCQLPDNMKPLAMLAKTPVIDVPDLVDLEKFRILNEGFRQQLERERIKGLSHGKEADQDVLERYKKGMALYRKRFSQYQKNVALSRKKYAVNLPEKPSKLKMAARQHKSSPMADCFSPLNDHCLDSCFKH